MVNCWLLTVRIVGGIPAPFRVNQGFSSGSLVILDILGYFAVAPLASTGPKITGSNGWPKLRHLAHLWGTRKPRPLGCSLSVYLPIYLCIFLPYLTLHRIPAQIAGDQLQHTDRKRYWRTDAFPMLMVKFARFKSGFCWWNPGFLLANIFISWKAVEPRKMLRSSRRGLSSTGENGAAIGYHLFHRGEARWDWNAGIENHSPVACGLLRVIISHRYVWSLVWRWGGGWRCCRPRCWSIDIDVHSEHIQSGKLAMDDAAAVDDSSESMHKKCWGTISRIDISGGTVGKHLATTERSCIEDHESFARSTLTSFI